MNLQRIAIIPGIFLAGFLLFMLSNLIFSPDIVARAATEDPAANTEHNDQVQTDEKACTLPPSYPESILQWCTWIEQYAARNSIPANLVAAVMLQESGGDPNSYSASGAVGLLQVMPSDGIAASFQCASGPCFASRPTMNELLDPQFNLEYGTRMLAGLINREGSIRDGLKSYGPFNVGYYYADKVLAIMAGHN